MIDKHGNPHVPTILLLLVILVLMTLTTGCTMQGYMEDRQNLPHHRCPYERVCRDD